MLTQTEQTKLEDQQGPKPRDQPRESNLQRAPNQKSHQSNQERDQTEDKPNQSEDNFLGTQTDFIDILSSACIFGEPGR